MGLYSILATKMFEQFPKFNLTNHHPMSRVNFSIVRNYQRQFIENMTNRYRQHILSFNIKVYPVLNTSVSISVMQDGAKFFINHIDHVFYLGFRRVKKC